MGLAASQARLLTLTARLADNELRSQTINNAKMRLSTESSQASEDYITALNEAQLQFSNYAEDGSSQTQSLTYNALTAYSSYNNQYGLVDSSNNILVSEEETQLYKEANGDLNKYLESHGLEYTTTYFDNVGAMYNENYPEPYNIMTVDEIEDMYNNYDAAENSVALQIFEDDYSLFQKYSQEAKNEASSAFKNILYNYKNGISSSSATTFENLDKTQIASIKSYATKFISDYKNAISGSGELTNDINGLQFIYDIGTNTLTEELTQEAVAIEDKDASGNPTTWYLLNDYIKLKPTTTTSTSGSTTTWTASLVQPDSSTTSGYKEVSTGSFKNTDNGETEAISLTNTKTSGSTDLNTLLSGLTLTISNTSSSTSSSSSYTGFTGSDIDKSITCTYKTNDDDEINSEVAALKNTIKNDIFNNLDLLEFAKIIENKYLQNSSETLEELGYDNASELNGLLDAIENYNEISDEYIGLIFGTGSDGSGLSELGDFIKKHALAKDLIYTTGTAENPEEYVLELSSLEDTDTILQIVNAINTGNIKDTSGNAVAVDDLPKTKDFPNTDFKTVIEYSLVDQMLDEYGEPVYTWVDKNDTGNTGDAYAKATWYTNLFNRMKNGYKTLENGLANSSEWIKYAFESGIVTMEQVNSNSEWAALSYSDCTKITEDYDQNAVTKAEAEYNRAMNDIETKDSAYDIQLKNIDTEHTSIQTEIDVVKNVISKNIERTMKFNQSA